MRLLKGNLQLGCGKFVVSLPLKTFTVKRIISLSFIVLSTLLLLICTVIPHHHHGQVPCFGVEHCEEDTPFDGGDAHPHSAPDGDDETCVLESKYIVSSPHRVMKPDVSYNREYGHGHIYLFPVYYLAAGCVNCGTGDSSLTAEYGGYLIFYKSAEAVRVRGLRAPPAIFS
jgi:hypothetical protein